MSAPSPKEIRDCFADYRDEWQEVRDEAATDMRYVAGDPWDAEDRAQREDAGRPCISLDEINQYLNQYINNLRQNKRAIQLAPKGKGATDADAARRSGLVKGIEDQSNAQLAYITAAESAVQRSYGFSVIRTEYRDDSSFDQEILIKPIVNPDTVLICPNYKQPDASDIEDGFLLELLPKRKYKAKYPKAEITDFSADATPGISDWIKEKNVQIAEYWRVEKDRFKLLLVETAKGPQIFTETEWKIAKELIKGEVKRDRTVEKPRVVQYLTNGLEILDEIPWAGSRIPIISCFGKEMWMTEGGTAKRKLFSMVRLARDPQMLFAFLATQECEEAGQIPKVPFVGAKGQFESDADVWEELAHVPHAYVQYDPVVDSTSGTNVLLPPPTRPQYIPNFQQWEIAKDSARRSIQAAMGISPLPTAAQRNNEKSGLALEKINDQEQIGSFHFVDNYKRYMHNMGWQVNELITPIIDTPREMPMKKPDGTRSTLKLVGNTSHPMDNQGAYDVQGLPEDHVHTGKGEFDVTIDDGPNYKSEREEQSSFVDTLIENWQSLGIAPPIANKILALAIKLKPDLGAIGTEIATLLNPPDPSSLPPEAQAIVQQLQGQIQQLLQENAALHMERAAKVLELKNKQTIEAMKGQHLLDKGTMDFITQIVKAELAKGSKAAEITAQSDAQKELAVLGFGHEKDMRAHDAAHEAGIQAVDHAHATDLATHQAALAPVPGGEESDAEPAD